MKNIELYSLREGINRILNVTGTSEFSYAAVKNLRIVQQEIEDIEKMFAPSDEYQEKFQKSYDELIDKYCLKHDNGSPQLVKNDFGQLIYKFEKEGREKFDKELKASEKKNKKLVDERTKQLKAKEEFLQKDNKVKIYKVDKKYVPEKLTIAQFSAIFPMIK